MSTDAITLWAGFGVVLILLELIIPGGIIMFPGIGALLVAAASYLGWIDNWVHALTFWFISSLLLLITFRQLTQRFVGGDSSIDNTDEEFDLYGKTVDVIETIGPGNNMGRVRYQGTTWTALSDGSVIEKDSTAVVICRDNISLVVEKK